MVGSLLSIVLFPHLMPDDSWVPIAGWWLTAAWRLAAGFS